ncbi:hypothetical protein D3C73_1365350 [compost metagenome]
MNKLYYPLGNECTEEEINYKGKPCKIIKELPSSWDYEIEFEDGHTMPVYNSELRDFSQENQNITNALRNFGQSFNSLNQHWQKSMDSILEKDYPFDIDFNELTDKVNEWVEQSIMSINNKIKPPRELVIM